VEPTAILIQSFWHRFFFADALVKRHKPADRKYKRGALAFEVDPISWTTEGPSWSYPAFADTCGELDAAASKASGLTPPMWLCLLVRL